MQYYLIWAVRYISRNLANVMMKTSAVIINEHREAKLWCTCHTYMTWRNKMSKKNYNLLRKNLLRASKEYNLLKSDKRAFRCLLSYLFLSYLILSCLVLSYLISYYYLISYLNLISAFCYNSEVTNIRPYSGFKGCFVPFLKFCWHRRYIVENVIT